MPLIGAEAVAASALAFLATAIASAYLSDSIGLAIRPLPILVCSAGAAAAMFVWLRRLVARDTASLVAFLGCVAATFAWLLWRARPDFLPTGSGPDLAHHLSLLEYIQRHWRLPHDVSLYEYLGEMVDYTPGSHLLAVLAGAWVGSDALHAVLPVVAGTVALKAGFVFLIARRVLPDDGPRVPFAVMAVVLLFLARVHFVGSFMEQSYLAQVVSELFAVAMWWALVVWDQRPSPVAAALFAIAGVATFLSWPVWVGPVMVVLGALALLHGELPLLTRLQHLVDRNGADRRCRRDSRLAPHRRIPDGGNGRLRDLADGAAARLVVHQPRRRGVSFLPGHPPRARGAAACRRNCPPGRSALSTPRGRAAQPRRTFR